MTEQLTAVWRSVFGTGWQGRSVWGHCGFIGRSPAQEVRGEPDWGFSGLLPKHAETPHYMKTSCIQNPELQILVG